MEITTIITIIITLAKILLLAWTITKFEPFFRWMIKYPSLKVKRTEAYRLILESITCFKCMSLWIGIFMTGNIWYGLVASLIAYLYIKRITRNNSRNENDIDLHG